MSQEGILVTQGLCKDFSGLRALDEVDMAVQAGTIHSLIGPNGSGKSTFFNVTTGLLPATSGRVLFEGRNVTGLKPHLRTRLGMSRTFQIPKVPPDMTCLENVMLGLHCRTNPDIWGTLLRAPFGLPRQERKIARKAWDLLELVGLEQQAHSLAGDLAWVNEQLLQLARALACQPRLLMLDEPTAGMGPEESEAVKLAIRHVQEMGMTVLLVAHDVNLVVSLSDKVTVLNFGRKIAEGSGPEVSQHPAVMEAYLGQE
jgi:branched-chain amino acid transport system ATP-binding protein